MSGAFKALGEGVSPGLGRGPAFLCPSERAPQERQQTPDAAATTLRDAIAATIADLRRLAERADLQSAAMLEFQVEMLMDPIILAPALDRIGHGAAASAAWAEALDDYIKGFTESDDDHIRARAGDMLDIRNQVLRALSGEKRPDFPRGTVF